MATDEQSTRVKRKCVDVDISSMEKEADELEQRAAALRKAAKEARDKDFDVIWRPWVNKVVARSRVLPRDDHFSQTTGFALDISYWSDGKFVSAARTLHAGMSLAELKEECLMLRTDVRTVWWAPTLQDLLPDGEHDEDRLRDDGVRLHITDCAIDHTVSQVRRLFRCMTEMVGAASDFWPTVRVEWEQPSAAHERYTQKYIPAAGVFRAVLLPAVEQTMEALRTRITATGVPNEVVGKPDTSV